MFRHEIKLTERADVAAEAAKLMVAAKASGVSEDEAEKLGLMFEATITPLVHAGRILTEQGSQMNVRRTFYGDNHKVMVVFGNTKAESLLSRIFGLIRHK